MSELVWKFLNGNINVVIWSELACDIRDVNEALFKYAREVSEKFLNDWTESYKLDHFISHNRYVGKQIENQNGNCVTCKDVFSELKKIRECRLLLIANPGYDRCWKLLKLFAPKECINIQALEDCDEGTLYKIIENCGLFNKLRNIDNLRRIRNDLMHSSEYRLSEAEKQKYIRAIKDILQPISPDCDAVDFALKKIDLRDQNSRKESGANKRYGDLKKAWDYQFKALEKDAKFVLDSGLHTFVDINKLKDMVLKRKDAVVNLIDTNKEFDKTFEEVVSMGSERGMKVLGDNFFGNTFGRATGAAGAFAAGCLKIVLQTSENKQGRLKTHEQFSDADTSYLQPSQKQQPTKEYSEFVSRLQELSKGLVIGKELNNITCTMVCLRESLQITFPEIMRRLNAEIDSWPDNLSSSFGEFCSDEKAGRIKFSDTFRKWQIVGSSKTSTDIFNKIVALHFCPCRRNIQWDCNDVPTAEPAFVLAKHFMPFGNKHMEKIDHVDVLSILELLKNCQLFQDFNLTVIMTLCDVRNAAMHCRTSDISDDDRCQFIGHMIDFVNLSCLSKAPNKDTVLAKLDRLRKGNVLVYDDTVILKECVRQLLPTNIQVSDEQLAECISNRFDSENDKILCSLNDQTDSLLKLLEKIEERKTVYTVVGRVAGGSLGLALGTGAAVLLGPVGIAVGGIAIIVGGVAGGVGGSVLNRITRVR